MKRILAAALAILAFALTAALAAPAPKAADEAGGCEVLHEKDFSVVLPRDWRKMDLAGTHYRVYLNGDGMLTPIADATGQPIQVGLTIEPYPNQKGNVLDGARRNVAAIDRNPDLKRVGEPVYKEFKLSDGTPAVLVAVEFIKEKTRRSSYQKVFVVDKDSTGWVLSAWIVAGKDSDFAAKNPAITNILQAHVCSFCLDKDKLDVEPVKKAYKDAERHAK